MKLILTIASNYMAHACEHAKSLQSCLTLRDPMDCSLPGSSVHVDSPGNNTEMGFHTLLQGIFPSQGSNLHLLCSCTGRWVHYHHATWEAPIWFIQCMKENLLQLHCTRNRNQGHSPEKEKQKGKMAVYGGLTNSCEKKGSKKQRGKGKIKASECRVPKNSKER